MRRLTYKEIKKYIESFNYKLLSTKYNNCSEKLKLECNKGHTYKISWSGFQQGYRCPECWRLSKYLNVEDIKKCIEDEGYKLLSENYTGAHSKLKLQCSKKHIYKVSWGNFYKGSRCPICNIEGKKLDYKCIKEQIESVNGYKLLSIKYKNNYSKLKVQCDKGHIYKVKWNVFQQNSRCPICYNMSRSGIDSPRWKNYTERELEEYKNYRSNITQLSNQNFRKCYYKINPNKLKRNSSNYHLDHIYSVADGFKNNIPVEVISNPNNLQMLWWNDNIVKSNRSDQTKQELYLSYYKYELKRL